MKFNVGDEAILSINNPLGSEKHYNGKRVIVERVCSGRVMWHYHVRVSEHGTIGAYAKELRPIHPELPDEEIWE